MAARDTTFILRFAGSGPGPRLAVKDLVDVAGTVTTAGCLAVADEARPAEADASCLRGARAAGAFIVGKTNLHELAYGADGINPHYGTPRNPLDPARIPGGSSSGSGVAVGAGDADVAIGSDTGGSIRLPAACCGIVGLKTTWGRIPVAGSYPLAPSLDTLGPMAKTLDALITGMDLLEPGFADAAGRTAPAPVIGRARLGPDCEGDPAVEAAVDMALASSGIPCADVHLPGWKAAYDAALVLLLVEAYRTNRHLLGREPRLSPALSQRIRLGERITSAQEAAARDVQRAWQRELDAALRRTPVIAVPSMPVLAPRLDAVEGVPLTMFTRAINLSGSPALALPVPVPAAFRRPETAHLPASIQLLGRHGGEELLCATGHTIGQLG